MPDARVSSQRHRQPARRQGVLVPLVLLLRFQLRPVLSPNQICPACMGPKPPVTEKKIVCATCKHETVVPYTNARFAALLVRLHSLQSRLHDAQQAPADGGRGGRERGSFG